MDELILVVQTNALLKTGLLLESIDNMLVITKNIQLLDNSNSYLSRLIDSLKIIIKEKKNQNKYLNV